MSYLWAGYLLTWGAIAWYAWRLEGRVSDAERQLERLAPEREDAPEGARTDGPPSARS